MTQPKHNSLPLSRATVKRMRPGQWLRFVHCVSFSAWHWRTLHWIEIFTTALLNV